MNLDLYRKYIKEREGKELIQNDHAFISYKILGEECFVADMYCDNDFRGQGHAFNLAVALIEIAMKSNCKYMSSNVHTELEGAQRSIQLQMKFGFNVIGGSGRVIFLRKEL